MGTNRTWLDGRHGLHGEGPHDAASRIRGRRQGGAAPVHLAERAVEERRKRAPPLVHAVEGPSQARDLDAVPRQALHALAGTGVVCDSAHCMRTHIRTWMQARRARFQSSRSPLSYPTAIIGAPGQADIATTAEGLHANIRDLWSAQKG